MEVDRGLGLENFFVRYHLFRFFLNQWFVVTLVENKDDRFFTASKVVGLSSDIWPSRKALKGNLQNIHMMLDLLYHKGNPLITAVVDGSIF